MGKSAVYNLANVVLTIGGVPITGFGSGASITIEQDEDDLTKTVGLDGEVALNVTNNTHATATITMLETSAGYTTISTLQAGQRGLIAAGTPILAYPFSMVDLRSGESITSGLCLFMNRPGITKGKEASDREFRLHLDSPVRTPALLNRP